MPFIHLMPPTVILSPHFIYFETEFVLLVCETDEAEATMSCTLRSFSEVQDRDRKLFQNKGKAGLSTNYEAFTAEWQFPAHTLGFWLDLFFWQQPRNIWLFVIQNRWGIMQIFASTIIFFWLWTAWCLISASERELWNLAASLYTSDAQQLASGSLIVFENTP